MTAWNTAEAQTLVASQEVQVVTRRLDGTLRRPTTIWIVGDRDEVFIRATNGREAAWFTGAVATGTGRILVRSKTFEVSFRELDAEADLARVDAGFRAKYGHYASIVDHLEEAGPRAATLQVLPA